MNPCDPNAISFGNQAVPLTFCVNFIFNITRCTDEGLVFSLVVCLHCHCYVVFFELY